MTSHAKEVAQYSTAIGFLASGIILCFCSFFLNEYHITESVLWFLGQASVFCGATFGISLYVKKQVADAEERLRCKMNNDQDNHS